MEVGRIEADYNTVEEGRGRKCNRFSDGHLYAIRRVELQRLEKKTGMLVGTLGLNLRRWPTASFDPQQRRPC